ncbi:hypothetical protein EV702DRAFT_1062827 [Suillus placidus]|uniref:Uncharacterized protein n=1 Tax=Suillus placidus TaxID=48579 RepID=A0A9P7A4V1_9AGAM|nr:hypothetical protein EV702DRAFT_1062827 [Suillus placidus]
MLSDPHLFASHIKWFESTANGIQQSLNVQRSNPIRERFLQMYASTLRYSVYRHIIVLEQSFRNLTPFIPRSVLLAKQLACYPLPPLTASSVYNDVFFAGAEEIFSVRPLCLRCPTHRFSSYVQFPIGFQRRRGEQNRIC